MCVCVCVSCTTPYVYVYDRQPPEAEMSERRGGGVLLVVKMPHGGLEPRNGVSQSSYRTSVVVVAREV